MYLLITSSLQGLMSWVLLLIADHLFLSTATVGIYVINQNHQKGQKIARKKIQKHAVSNPLE